MRPFLVSSYFATYPLTILLQILGARDGCMICHSTSNCVGTVPIAVPLSLRPWVAHPVVSTRRLPFSVIHNQWHRQSFEVGGRVSEMQPRPRSPGVYYVRVGEMASAEGARL